jgi:hypothetical protein
MIFRRYWPSINPAVAAAPPANNDSEADCCITEI